MNVMIDCPRCGARHEWDISNPSKLCPRCTTLTSGDIDKILVECRKTRIPGQEPILGMIEALNEKLKRLSAELKEKGEALDAFTSKFE